MRTTWGWFHVLYRSRGAGGAEHLNVITCNVIMVLLCSPMMAARLRPSSDTICNSLAHHRDSGNASGLVTDCIRANRATLETGPIRSENNVKQCHCGGVAPLCSVSIPSHNGPVPRLSVSSHARASVWINQSGAACGQIQEQRLDGDYTGSVATCSGGKSASSRLGAAASLRSASADPWSREVNVHSAPL